MSQEHRNDVCHPTARGAIEVAAEMGQLLESRGLPPRGTSQWLLLLQDMDGHGGLTGPDRSSAVLRHGDAVVLHLSLSGFPS